MPWGLWSARRWRSTWWGRLRRNGKRRGRIFSRYKRGSIRGRQRTSRRSFSRVTTQTMHGYMKLIDANVFFYAAGSPHPYRDASTETMRRIQRGEIEAAISTEILQEVLHYYRRQH